MPVLRPEDPPPPSPRHVLLTAFEPFGGYRENASLAVQSALVRHPPHGVTITPVVLPVDFAAVGEPLESALAAGPSAAPARATGAQMAEAWISDSRAAVAEAAGRLDTDSDGGRCWDAVVLLGQAAQRQTVDLERLAINFARDVGDPPWRDRPVIPGGPVALETTLPVETLAEAAQTACESQFVRVTVSAHAGTYLCNAAYYRALWWCQRHAPRTGCLFVHVPLLPTQKSLSHGGFTDPGPDGDRARRESVKGFPTPPGPGSNLSADGVADLIRAGLEHWVGMTWRAKNDT